MRSAPRGGTSPTAPATRRAQGPARSAGPGGDPRTPRMRSAPRGGTSPTHRPLAGRKARLAGPVTSVSPLPVRGARRYSLAATRRGLAASARLAGSCEKDVLGVIGRAFAERYAGGVAGGQQRGAHLEFPSSLRGRYFQTDGYPGTFEVADGERRPREGPWICEAFAFPDAGVMKEGPDRGPSWAYPGPSETPVSVTRQAAGGGPAGPPHPYGPVAAVMVTAWARVTRASPGTGS